MGTRTRKIETAGAELRDESGGDPGTAADLGPKRREPPRDATTKAKAQEVGASRDEHGRPARSGGRGHPRLRDGAHRLWVIEPPSPSARGTLGEVWRYRHAYPYFLRQNIRRRYGRTFLGYLSIFLPVVVPVLLGSLVFGGILGISPGEASRISCISSSRRPRGSRSPRRRCLRRGAWRSTGACWGECGCPASFHSPPRWRCPESVCSSIW